MKTGIIKRNGKEYVKITCGVSERRAVSITMDHAETEGISPEEVTVYVKTGTPHKYLKKFRFIWKHWMGLKEEPADASPVREPIASIADLIERRKVDGFNINMMEIASRHTKPGDAIDGAMWLMGALEALAQDGYITTEEYDGLMKAL